jgi:hypothetical protein
MTVNVSQNPGDIWVIGVPRPTLGEYDFVRKAFPVRFPQENNISRSPMATNDDQWVPVRLGIRFEPRFLRMGLPP